MKNKFTLLALLFVTFCYSQSPSSTRKWNDYSNRYEYFDSENNLIGYEKYNDYKKQWEYFKLNERKNSYSGSDKAFDDLLASQERQLDRLYAQKNAVNNQVLAMQEARKETERVNYYHSVIKDKYNELTEKIKSSNFTIDDKEKFLEKFDSKVNYADETYTNLSSHTVATNKLNLIIKSYNDLLQEYNDNRLNPIIGKVLQLDSKFGSAIYNKVPKGFNFLDVSYDEIMESGTYSYVIREYVSARKSFGSLLNEGNLTYEKANSLYSKMLVEYYKVYDK